jgi:hypothetical protein
MENKATLITAILSAITALLVAAIGFYGNSQLEQIRSQSEADTQSRTIQLERDQLKANQDANLQKILLEYVPKLVGANENDRKAAVAVLFVLYPNDAKSYIDRATASLGSTEQATFQPTIKQADALAAKTGSWAIVVGSDTSLDAAKFEVTRAEKQGYTPAVVYKRGQWFVTTLGNYPSQDIANSEAIAVRVKIRSSAFTVNLNSWCPNPAAKDGYSECSSQ